MWQPYCSRAHGFEPAKRALMNRFISIKECVVIYAETDVGGQI
jgi:hypothetical protein